MRNWKGLLTDLGDAVIRSLTLPWRRGLPSSPMRCVRYGYIKYRCVCVYITVRWSQCYHVVHGSSPPSGLSTLLTGGIVREPRSYGFRGCRGSPRTLLSETDQVADRASDLVKAHEGLPPCAMHLPGIRRLSRRPCTRVLSRFSLCISPFPWPRPFPPGEYRVRRERNGAASAENPLATLRLARSECTDGNRSRKLYMQDGRRSGGEEKRERERTGLVCENARRMRADRKASKFRPTEKGSGRTIENKENDLVWASQLVKS